MPTPKGEIELKKEQGGEDGCQEERQECEVCEVCHSLIKDGDERFLMNAWGLLVLCSDCYRRRQSKGFAF